MPSIEWRRERRRILLPIQILPPFPITDLRGADAIALIDTGSSVSGIASGLAERLGLKGQGGRPLVSAQGQSHVERYSFRIGLSGGSSSGAVPRFPVVFAEVIGMELTNAFEFNALVGMDVLGQCDFTMERAGRCSLTFG
jgi:hypothetical protein